jgi:hypothetical protein
MNQQNRGVNQLARVIDERLREGSGRAFVDFGEIQPDMSLRLNQYPIPIPKGDYLSNTDIEENLQAGTRVLVMWVGNDLVVVCRLNRIGGIGHAEFISRL